MLTTRDKLRARIGEVDATDARLDAAIEDASADIMSVADESTNALGENPSLGWDVSSDNVPPEVELVCLRAARREILNPEELVNEQEGDVLGGSTGRHVSLYLRPDEVRRVQRAAQRADGRPRGVSVVPLSAPIGPSWRQLIQWGTSTRRFPWNNGVDW